MYGGEDLVATDDNAGGGGDGLYYRKLDLGSVLLAGPPANYSLGSFHFFSCLYLQKRH